MNTLLIQDEFVSFIGFDHLKDTAYFIFREGGLVISGKKSDVIMPQEIYQIENRKIVDKDLWLKLKQKGFLYNHSFIIKDGIYYCAYPVVSTEISDIWLRKFDRLIQLKNLNISFWN